MGESLAEWIVTAPDGAQMMLQMAYFDRGRDPVVMDIGAVLDLEYVASGKVCALAGRVEPRDYADTAAMLDRFSPGQLLGFAGGWTPAWRAATSLTPGTGWTSCPIKYSRRPGSAAKTSRSCGSSSPLAPHRAAADRALEPEPPGSAQRRYRSCAPTVTKHRKV
jgi:hypothetical protein